MLAVFCPEELLPPPPPWEERWDVPGGMEQIHVPVTLYPGGPRFSGIVLAKIPGSGGLAALPGSWHLCCRVASPPLPAGVVSVNLTPLGPAGVSPQGGGVVALSNRLFPVQFWIWTEGWCEPSCCHTGAHGAQGLQHREGSSGPSWGLGGSLANSPDLRKEISQEVALIWGCWAGRTLAWAPPVAFPILCPRQGQLSPGS